jgi:tetratricopeptide (TPR) repeat protein
MERCDRPDEALQVMADAAAIDPRNAAVPLRTAKLQFRRRQFDAQAAALDDAEQLFRDRSNAEGVGEVLATRGMLDAERGRLDAAGAALAKASELAAGLEDVRLRIRVLIQQAIVRRKQGDAAGAARLLEEATALARRENLEPLTVDGLFALGNLHIVRLELADAEKLFTQVLGIAQAYRHELHQAGAWLSLATVFIPQGQPARAEEALLTARRYFERTGYTRRVADCDALLGQVLVQLARYDEAVARFEREREAARRQGDAPQEERAQSNLASVLASVGDYPKALAEYRAVRERRRLSGRKPDEVYAALNVADMHSRMGRFDDADAAFADAARIGVETPDVVSQALRMQAALALRRGDNQRALRDASRVVTLRAAIPERLTRAALIACLAAARLGLRAESERMCGRALADTKDPGRVALWIETRLAVAEQHLAFGNRAAADGVLREVEPVLGKTSYEDRWRIPALALAAGAAGRDLAAERAALTRELETLRLKWGDPAVYEEWARRADVRALLAAAAPRGR